VERPQAGGNLLTPCCHRDGVELWEKERIVNPVAGRHPGRNEPCHCGSGRKYKHCCLEKDEAAAREASAETEQASPPSPESAPVNRRPKHNTYQPWKKSGTTNTHGFHRMSTPRKVGG
jgi:hypothetical protein